MFLEGPDIKDIKDFENWPLNRVWPLKREPLYTGSTVVQTSIQSYSNYNFHIFPKYTLYMFWETD